MGKREAARLFKVSPNTIYEWLKRGDDLSPRPVKTRKRKIDRAALEAHVIKHPDLYLRERAEHFGVDPSAISYHLRLMQIVKKSA
jgi:excisionase family DNA binding protein